MSSHELVQQCYGRKLQSTADLRTSACCDAADVYADRQLPEAVRRDPVPYGECLGGALDWNDFLRLAPEAPKEAAAALICLSRALTGCTSRLEPAAGRAPYSQSVVAGTAHGVHALP